MHQNLTQIMKSKKNKQKNKNVCTKGGPRARLVCSLSRFPSLSLYTYIFSFLMLRHMIIDMTLATT